MSTVVLYVSLSRVLLLYTTYSGAAWCGLCVRGNSGALCDFVFDDTTRLVDCKL